MAAEVKTERRTQNIERPALNEDKNWRAKHYDPGQRRVEYAMLIIGKMKTGRRAPRLRTIRVGRRSIVIETPSTY
jgi:hypothetical protein